MLHTAVQLVIPLLFAASATSPRVVVVSAPGEPAPAGLVVALRVQLAGIATVEIGPELPGNPLAVKLDAAATVVAERGAILAVWVEQSAANPGDAAPSGDLHYVLYAVATRRDRGIIEVGRVTASDRDASGDSTAAASSLDRVLALKIAALVDDILSARTAADPPAIASALTSPPPSPVPTPPTRSTRIRGTADVALFTGLAGGNLGTQSGLVLGLGGRLERATFLAEVFGSLLWPRDGQYRAEAGVVVLSEVAVGGGGRALRGLGPLAVGGAIELRARRIHARGIAPDGEMGAAVRWLPVVRGTLELRTVIAPRVEVRAAMGGELALVHERFAVLGEVVADVGRARVIGELGVVFALP